VELALEESGAVPADLFRPLYDRTGGTDAGCRWKSPRCLPATRSKPSTRPLNIQSWSRPAESLSQDSRHPEGCPPSRRPIFAGVPVNVTLLFFAGAVPCRRRCLYAGLERRIAAGLDPRSVPLPRCSSAVGPRRDRQKCPRSYATGLGIAIGMRTYVRMRLLETKPGGDLARPERENSACSGHSYRQVKTRAHRRIST